MGTHTPTTTLVRTAVAVTCAIAFAVSVTAVSVIEFYVPERLEVVVEWIHLAVVCTLAGVLFLRIVMPRISAAEERLADLATQEQEVIDNLRELEARRGRILTLVAHEVRTPITVLHGSLEMMRRTCIDTSPERRGMWDAVVRASERLLVLPLAVDAAFAGDGEDHGVTGVPSVGRSR